MLKINEDILQFAWQHKLLKPLPIISSSGKEIKIIRHGELNRDSGPDFFNAQIQINDIKLAGNIEVHVKTSDWLKHKHQNDRAYDNIILHLVYHNDLQVEQNTTHNVEVVELENLLPENLLKDYSELINSRQMLACGNLLPKANEFKFSAWMQRMLLERLEYKTKWITEVFESCNGDYSQTFYTLILRNFGFKTNALPFELLSKQLPLSLLLKHADNLLQVEALLFGTAGMLEEQYESDYIRKIQNEFSYLRAKYRIIPLEKRLFKFSRLRPANFPTLRLAQFAMLVHLNPSLIHKPHTTADVDQIKHSLALTPEGYWKNHYTIDGKKSESDLSLGKDSIENILVNSYATFLFFYSRKTGLMQYEELSFKILERCIFEANSKTKLFQGKKESLKSAADSQAAIHLYDNYCTKRRCLACGIAADVLK